MYMILANGLLLQLMFQKRIKMTLSTLPIQQQLKSASIRRQDFLPVKAHKQSKPFIKLIFHRVCTSAPTQSKQLRYTESCTPCIQIPNLHIQIPHLYVQIQYLCIHIFILLYTVGMYICYSPLLETGYWAGWTFVQTYGSSSVPMCDHAYIKKIIISKEHCLDKIKISVIFWRREFMSIDDHDVGTTNVVCGDLCFLRNGEEVGVIYLGSYSIFSSTMNFVKAMVKGKKNNAF